MRIATLLLVLLALSGSAYAAEPTVEEWHYLQRVKLIVDVNEQLWNAFEEQGGWNTELAAYARDSCRLSAGKLRLWGPPSPALLNFHRQFVELVVLQDKFYDAISQTNFGVAHEIGDRLETQMLDFQSAWLEIHERFEK